MFYELKNNEYDWLNPYKEQRFIVIGEKGMIVFDDTTMWEEKLKLYDKPTIRESNSSFAIQTTSFKSIGVDYE